MNKNRFVGRLLITFLPSFYVTAGTTPPLSPASPSGYSSHSAGPSPWSSPAYADGDSYPGLSISPDAKKLSQSPRPPAPLLASRPGTFYAVNPDEMSEPESPTSLYGEDGLLSSPTLGNDDEDDGDKRDTLRAGTTLPLALGKKAKRKSRPVSIASSIGLAYADEEEGGMRIMSDSPRSGIDDLPPTSPTSHTAKRTSGQTMSSYSRSTVHSPRALNALLSAVPDHDENSNHNDEGQEEEDEDDDDDDDDIILANPYDSSERGSRLMARSNTVPAPPTSPSTMLPANAVRRSHTSPITKPLPAATRRRRHVCIRCEKAIEDGRWVAVEQEGHVSGEAMDGADVAKKKEVMCERCWKNMYLPKVRLFCFLALWLY
jgi:hypothetical protein